MSSKDGQPPSSPDATAPPTVAPVSDVPPGVRVHHFDELSERTQRALATATPAGTLDIDTTTSRLSRGDIVVFTDYVRVK
ncbi:MULTISPECIES: hypothetical protein [Haloferax]|jgi:hypothetical protein|uniref:DUF7979 domain-containing protein n=2 Tax=Haloferax TaxID=2251 RepID=A0A6C0UM87_HALVO|nr:MULTISPECIES: hypothetical protein [Haloferax]MBC9987033.1 hypothetical protein [Haloferax sp. AS1]NLV03928.1 hypothetical protein [Haloferax alexandrinus]QIB76605.1 hypothetical protein G3A49_14945 [Haloferax alexandrinus]TVT95166.1 hypothetical protein FQA18_07835 [Haloferax volcanii]WEL30452.1 Uncharacterized protein HBNXHx_2353 [Haloferax alexandrinus]